MADDDFPLFLCRMRFVVEDASQWVAKHGPGFFETNAVLPAIDLALSLVPLKVYGPVYLFPPHRTFRGRRKYSTKVIPMRSEKRCASDGYSPLVSSCATRSTRCIG